MSSTVRTPFLRVMRLGHTADLVSGHPFDLPAVRDLDAELAAVTVLVGDNGSGKSTIVEAIAVAAGFNAEGGGRNLQFATLSTHGVLHEHLELRWRQRPRWGWFLRAETFSAWPATSRSTTGSPGRSRISTTVPTANPSSS